MLDSLDTLIAFVLIMLVVSLLITIAVQMMGAALNLRGCSVAKGLRQSLNAILPGFEAMGKQFADHVLTGPLLSDSNAKWLPDFWRRASAVRPDEVFDSIHRIAIGRKAASEEFRKSAQSLLVALGFDQKALEDAANEVTSVAENARKVARAAMTGSDASGQTSSKAQTALDSVATGLHKLALAQGGRAVAGVVVTASAIDTAYRQFQYWFEIGQERAGQWFTMHTRICTIFLAFIFAFWLQLDTIEIFKLVSTNRVVRDKLVAQASAVTSQAEKIIGDGNKILQDALDAWRDAITDANIKQAVLEVKVAPSDSRGTLRQNVEKALDRAQIASKDALLVAFDKAVDDTAQKKLDDGAKDYSALKRSLNNTGFDLFINSNLGRWGHGWCVDFWPHSSGMLFSAALLSLGAPFWYNSLKGLTSLRSTVAQNISKEQVGDQPHPSQAATKVAPPTV